MAASWSHVPSDLSAWALPYSLNTESAAEEIGQVSSLEPGTLKPGHFTGAVPAAAPLADVGCGARLPHPH